MTNWLTSLLDFIRWRVGVGELTGYHENEENDGKLNRLVIVKQILFVSIVGNDKITVRRI